MASYSFFPSQGIQWRQPRDYSLEQCKGGTMRDEDAIAKMPHLNHVCSGGIKVEKAKILLKVERAMAGDYRTHVDAKKLGYTKT